MAVPLFASASFLPQKADPLLERWRWSHIAELDGKGFACMTENRDGLWFGVQDGVIFYDGRKWISYTTRDGLFDGPVTTLRAAKDGTIWAASGNFVSSNLCVFKEGRWKSIFAANANALPTLVPNVLESADGSIWAVLATFPTNATQNSIDSPDQSVIMRLKANEVTLYGISTCPLAHIIPQARLISFPTNLASNAWTYLFEDRSGCLWISCNPVGNLACWNPQNGPLESADAWRVFDAAAELQSRWDPLLLETHDGQILLGFGEAAKSIMAYDPKQDRWSVALPNIDRINSMLETRDGTVWATAHSRLLVRRGGTWQTYDVDTLGLSAGSIQLFESANGDLWFGTQNGGVFRLDYSEQRWVSYDGLNFQGDDSAGAQWFLGVDGSVVRRLAGEWTRFDVTDGLISHPVTVLCAKDGRIWAAGSHQGVAATACFENGQWHRQLHPDLGWTIDFRSALEDLRGNLWFGANNEPIAGRGFQGGIVRYDQSPAATNHWTHLLPPQVPNAVCGITQLPDGRIYYGGWNVTEQQATGCLTITDPPELATYWIDSVAASPAGDLWVSRGGIAVFRRHESVWTRFGPDADLADLMVSTLFCAQDGTVWAATPKGISRFDGRSWTRLAFPTESIAIDRECGNLRQSRDGRLWINSAPRKWCFRAKEGESYTAASLPGFRTIGYLAGHLAPATKLNVTFSNVSQPGNTLIAWEGSDPWERTPVDSLEFSYRLDHGEWSPYKPDKQKMFLALPTGQHTFEVRTRDLDFNVDPTPPRFEFVVVAPVWRQPWFLCLLMALLGAIVAQTVRLLRRDRRLRTTNHALAIEIQEHQHTESQLREKTGRLEAEITERKTVQQALEKEIEERKRMEREVQQAHQRLMEASRLAGMADVATNVLHNVGNTLNSINVSVGLLLDHLKRSRAVFVGRVADLMKKHAADLGRFLTHNPQGQQVPSYLANLGGQLMREQAAALAELNGLQQNVGHINQIVAMQQDYARAPQVAARVNIIELVEAAVQMGENMLPNRPDPRVKIVTQFQAAHAEITVDRHKVLQILVNLIANAGQACDEAQLPDRQITIRVTDGEKRIQIAVIDNGVGIPPENLTRIFNHGFTTRKDGHGFGLHYAALAAKELNGRLSVQSDGAGKGATFTLDLLSKSEETGGATGQTDGKPNFP
jgi:signal transduction histidine kinase/ligand-binding sensor domain-containing protein